MLSHENIVSNVRTLQQIVLQSSEKPEDHRSLSFLPWAHAFGQTVELHLLIASGASMAIAEGVDSIALNIQEVKPTVLVAVPRVFLKIHAGIEKLMAERSRLVRWLFRRGITAGKKVSAGHSLGLFERALRHAADRLIFAQVRKRFGGRLRFAISGAASLPAEVAEFIDALGITVYEGYGLTETSPIAAANVPGYRKLGSVGRPLPGVRIVIDESVSDDPAQGEIVVYGPNVMLGYYERAAETGLALAADGGLRTGDLGYLDAENYLFVTGRIKEQYKLTNGKYVSPAPLEDRLKLSALIANVMIYGDNRPHNVALVVPEPAALLAWARREGLPSTTLEELIRLERVRQMFWAELERLSADFRGYERIRAFALLGEDFTQENEMLTPSLKLRRRKIVARWASSIELLYSE
jgi:long-chain acyl-CoA synthetase